MKKLSRYKTVIGINIEHQYVKQFVLLHGDLLSIITAGFFRQSQIQNTIIVFCYYSGLINIAIDRKTPMYPPFAITFGMNQVSSGFVFPFIFVFSADGNLVPIDTDTDVIFFTPGRSARTR